MPRALHRFSSLVDLPPEWLEIASATQTLLWVVGALVDPLVLQKQYGFLLSDFGNAVPVVVVGCTGALLQVVAAFLDDGLYRTLIAFAMALWWALIAGELSRHVGGSPSVMTFLGIASENLFAVVLLLGALLGRRWGL